MALERKVTKRPSRLIPGNMLCRLPSTPAWFLLSRIVVGAAVAAPAVPARTTAVAVSPATAAPTVATVRGMRMEVLPSFPATREHLE